MSTTRRPVVGNDWSVLVPPADAAWTPNSLVSICIPTRNPGRGLQRMLLCLAEQTYPTHLFEVVIADDGSDAPVSVPDTLPYEVRVVRQERTLDFGAGRARNLASRSASGDILFFLDADVIPERQVVESYARWFAQDDLAVPMGLCRFVDADDLDDAELVELIRTSAMGDHFESADIDEQAWRERHFVRTNDLRVEAVDAFRVTIGATLAVDASLFADVGGFPELGVRGVEDTAFGYRVHNDGGILILDRDALHWHQGRRHLSDPSVRERINKVRAPYVASVIPVVGFRRGDPPASPPVEVAPVARVRVHGEPVPTGPELSSVAVSGSADVALGTGPVGATSDSAFLQVDLPAGVVWGATTLRRIVDTISQHPVGVVRALVEGSDGDVVTIARTRAVRRGVRVRPDADPVATAGELFGTWWVNAGALGLHVPDTLDEPAGVPSEVRPPLTGRAFDAFVELLRRAAT